MRLLMKFGGTSVADEACIRRVADIVGHYRNEGHEVCVVVSAMAGVTDHLHAIAEEVVLDSQADSEDHVSTFIDAMRTRHEKVLRAVAPEEADAVLGEINIRLGNLKNILNSVHNLRELTPRSRDYVISFGERLSALVVSAAFRADGISSLAMNGCEAGIITNGRHGCAQVLPESENRIKSRIAPLLSETVPVVMGYMGCTGQGVVTTLGRSGSDYSAAVVGTAIDVDEIWIWTDVDGVMTSDPRIIDDARVLPALSYLEAMELSYFGAKVLHPRSVEPAIQKGIMVRVKNTFNPDHPGTRVMQAEQRDKRVVKSISYIEKVSLIAISGAQMIGRPGVAHRIFSALADRDVNVMMISQGSSEANISLIVDDEHLDNALAALDEVRTKGYIRSITHDRDVIAVAVVGVGMAGTPGISGRIFTALGRVGVNVMMISQGSSEVNVSFVVKLEHGPKALRVLHDEFGLAEEQDDE